MRIILVVDTAHVNGGQAKVCFDSALGLKARGHEPIVFSAVAPVSEALTAAGIEVHCLDQFELVKDPDKLGAAWRGIHNAAAAKALGALLARQPREGTVVHVHGWAKALSSSIAQPIAASNLPVLYTMHEYFMLCPNGGFYNYRAHHHCHLQPLSAACLTTHCDSRSFGYKLWRTARTAAAKYVHDLPGAMKDVAYFHPFQRSIIEKHLPETTRMHEVPNPIEVDNLGPKDNPTAGEIIFLGRVSDEKGVMLYCEAARRAGQVPVIVGDGPAAEAIRSAYPDAKMLGWHDGAGVRKRLREARALVFPSLWYEGQPLTVLESLALGTPVIAGDGTAGRESVVHGETGLWFRQADPDDLARALKAMEDDALAARLSHNAYTRYWENPFSIERHCARLEEVYAGLV
jgi:glycosyltransferase involved in cell wall biosynthesis